MEQGVSVEVILKIYNQLTPENQVRARAFVDALTHGYTGTVQEWIEMEEREGTANALAKVKGSQ